MRSPALGWSYPPGCYGPPSETEYPCVLCGETDACQCPECKCGDVGCVEHLEFTILSGRLLLAEYQAEELRKAYAKRPESKCAKHGPITPADGCCWGCVYDEAQAEHYAEHRRPPGT